MSGIVDTRIDQRSYYNSWAVGELHALPSGVILDCSFVTDSYISIKLSGITIIDGTLSITFTDDSGTVATGEFQEPGQYSLECAGHCLYANIEIGYIPTVAFSLYSAITINPCCISCLKKYEVANNKLTIQVDGSTTSYELTKDCELVTNNGVNVSIDENTVLVGLADNVIQRFKPLVNNVIRDNTIITSINGVKPVKNAEDKYEIKLDIKYNNEQLSVTTRPDNTVVLHTSGSVMQTCDTRDPINEYLSPALHAADIFYPLDDMYTTDTDYDVKLLEAQKYMGLNLMDKNEEADCVC